MSIFHPEICFLLYKSQYVKKAHISLKWHQIQKIRTHYFLQHLKLKEKSHFIFWTRHHGRYELFVIFDLWEGFWYLHDMTKLPLLTRINSDPENKSTFIFQNFKVEENNMSLFFGSDVIWVRIWAFWHIVTCKGVSRYLHKTTRRQKAHISIKWCWIKQIKALYFL